jgi:hypothetical protein
LLFKLSSYLLQILLFPCSFSPQGTPTRPLSTPKFTGFFIQALSLQGHFFGTQHQSTFAYISTTTHPIALKLLRRLSASVKYLRLKFQAIRTTPSFRPEPVITTHGVEHP